MLYMVESSIFFLAAIACMFLTIRSNIDPLIDGLRVDASSQQIVLALEALNSMRYWFLVSAVMALASVHHFP